MFVLRVGVGLLHAMAYIQISENSFVVLVCVGTSIWNQVTKFHVKHLNLLNHLTITLIFFLNILAFKASVEKFASTLIGLPCVRAVSVLLFLVYFICSVH